MFNKDFYPTPRDVALKMIEGINLSDTYILEPSAGKGDILDVICSGTYEHRRKERCYAIEIEPELQAILSEKGYKVLGSDFLAYGRDINFDYIIANFPFSNGDEHFLHAWDILRNGTLICLLNEETILNPYSEKRKLVSRIIEDHGGTVEYIGDCFRGSERSTGVRVAMVKVSKNTVEKEFDFGEFSSEKIEFSEEVLKNEVATLDMVQNIIDDYERSKEFYAKGIQYINQAARIAGSISENYKCKPFEIASSCESVNERVNKFIKEMKLGVWMKLAKELKIEKYMSQKVRDDFRDKIERQGAMAVNKENIKLFAQVIFQNRQSIVEDSILEVFDEFTKYYKENRVHVEGWKTNDSWKVNRKVILPYWIEYDHWSDSFKDYTSRLERIGDVEKVMCYLTGLRIEDVRSVRVAIKKASPGEKFETTFFECRAYKKGTIHLYFRDEKLWQDFNMNVAYKRNWLPPEEKKKYENDGNQSKHWEAERSIGLYNDKETNTNTTALSLSI